jgi:hypothetical protein
MRGRLGSRCAHDSARRSQQLPAPARIAWHMTQVARPKCRHVRRVVARHGWVIFCSRLAVAVEVRCLRASQPGHGGPGRRPLSAEGAGGPWWAGGGLAQAHGSATHESLRLAGSVRTQRHVRDGPFRSCGGCTCSEQPHVRRAAEPARGLPGRVARGGVGLRRGRGQGGEALHSATVEVSCRPSCCAAQRRGSGPTRASRRHWIDCIGGIAWRVGGGARWEACTGPSAIARVATPSHAAVQPGPKLEALRPQAYTEHRAAQQEPVQNTDRAAATAAREARAGGRPTAGVSRWPGSVPAALSACESIHISNVQGATAEGRTT